MSLLFTETASIKKAVEIINTLDAVKFPRLLARILQKLHLKDERAFSEEEENKLEVALSVSAQELQLIIETCEFFLHQAAYHTAKPAVVKSQLEQLGMVEDKVVAIVTAWQNSAKEVVDKLRQRTLPPKQLDSIGWRLGLTMASSMQSKVKSPVATLEFGVKDENTEKMEHICMEFSHEELYKFYDQLETIQGQIDNLS